MERRRFILLAGVGAGMCLIPPSLYFIAPGVKRYAANAIEKEFHYLKFAPGTVGRYVDDYFASNANNTMENLRWKVIYYTRISYEKSDRLKDLLKYFLLSTDFFINKTDESKVVNYLGKYSPYLSPIPNPYSFIIYPPNSIKEA